MNRKDASKQATLFAMTQKGLWLFLLGLLCQDAYGQSKSGPAPKAPPSPIEAGLEMAVRWRWKVVPGSDVWNAIQPTVRITADQNETGGIIAPEGLRVITGPPDHPLEHRVVKGETLSVISRQYYMTVEQLKKANDLKSDLIRIDQVLTIPSKEQVRAMQPVPKVEVAPATKGNAEPSEELAETSPELQRPKYRRPLPTAAMRAGHIVLNQSYLDRQLFSTGPIDGFAGTGYEAAISVYRETHPGVLDYVNGETPLALRSLGSAYVEYVLTEADMKWIDSRALSSIQTAALRGTKVASLPTADPEWDDLVGAQELLYRSTWEFVAERFHCSESFLRSINSGLRSPHLAGAIFLVPNVEPFEVENQVKLPARPEVNGNEPIQAKIVNLTHLHVIKGDQLIARVPLSVARPGLRGRGIWRIMEAISAPTLVSTGEWNSPPRSIPGQEDVMVLPPPADLLIPKGPNSPLGLIWINLTKDTETEPLPYGLHGTSIPGLMHRQESLGGFRLANWDISRVLALLPEGTPLLWE